MVCDDAERNVGFVIFLIGDPCNLADVFHNVLHGINLKEIVYLLHNAGKAFQAHTGINVRMFHRSIVAVSVRVKLRKHKIPEFYKTVAVTADCAARFTAAEFFPAVEIDFGTGTAWS